MQGKNSRNSSHLPGTHRYLVLLEEHKLQDSCMSFIFFFKHVYKIIIRVPVLGRVFLMHLFYTVFSDVARTEKEVQGTSVML